MRITVFKFLTRSSDSKQLNKTEEFIKSKGVMTFAVGVENSKYNLEFVLLIRKKLFL